MAKRSSLTAIACAFGVSTAFALIDFDEDGMSDVWEDEHGFPTDPDDGSQAPEFGPFADPDGDGVMNIDEAAAGTDPFDPHPYAPPGFTVNGRFWAEPGEDEESGYTLTVWGVLGKEYRLWEGGDLDSFVPVGDAVIGTDEFIVFETSSALDDPPPASVFWKVVVADIDSDGDFVTDYEEYLLGTSPFLLDEDGDGIPTYYELVEEWDPLDPESGDFDQYLGTPAPATFEVFTPLH